MKPISGRYDRFATNRDFKVHFGLDPLAKWPRHGLEPIIIEGWKVWVTPSPGTTSSGSPGRRHKSSTHRVLTQCPQCLKVFSAGRIRQHIKIHAEGAK